MLVTKTKREENTVIRLFLKKQSDLSLHCLPRYFDRQLESVLQKQ